jgi:protein ImuB
MPVAEATALSADARAVSLRLERYDAGAARTALVTLASWCDRFSPVVGLEEGEHPESLLLDVTGLGPLFQGERGLIERVAREFCRQGWQACLALADTIGAAWALAHYAAEDAAAERGGLLVPASESLASAAQLPIAALRLGQEETQLLHDLGLQQIGQLQTLPRSAVAARFGPELLRRWDQLNGTAEEMIRSEGCASSLTASWSCEQPIARGDVIEAIIQRLLEQLTRTLADEQRGVLRLECRLQGIGRMNVTFSLGLFRPSAAPGYLFDLVRLKLDRLRLTEPVAEIHLAVTMTELLECRQGELFATFAGRDDPRELARLVDRFSSRLGRECVLRAVPSNDAQPEQACSYRPLVTEKTGRELARGAGGHKKGTRSADRLSPQRRGGSADRDDRRFKWSQRPLRLAAQPVPLAVTAVVPDGPLLWFTLAGRQHRIAQSWGPERIETGWWRGRTVRRDYYRVETVDGQRHWLFRRLTDGAWYWHGDFE